MEQLKCLRCGTTMKKHSIRIRLGFQDLPDKPFHAHTQQPINVKSAYYCENCGYVEFNINE